MLARTGLDALGRHLRAHPEELLHALSSAARMRLSVPVPALQWLADRRDGVRGPRNLRIEPAPPGLRISADLELMATPVHAAASIRFESVTIGPDLARIEIALHDVEVRTLGDSQTTLAALLRSGALDLGKAGNLAAELPRVRTLLADSHENHLVIDLMKHPRLATNPAFRRALEVVSAFATVRRVEVDRSRIHVALRPLPQGLRAAARAIGRQILPQFLPSSR